MEGAWVMEMAMWLCQPSWHCHRTRKRSSPADALIFGGSLLAESGHFDGSAVPGHEIHHLKQEVGWYTPGGPLCSPRSQSPCLWHSLNTVNPMAPPLLRLEEVRCVHRHHLKVTVTSLKVGTDSQASSDEFSKLFQRVFAISVLAYNWG